MIVSDGCTYVDIKARNVIRTKYSTNDASSIKIFLNSINKIYGQVHINKEHVRNCEILRIGLSLVGETLLKVGAILGHKARRDKGVPWLILKGSKCMKKHYLKAVFGDEAAIYNGEKSCGNYIILSRSKHIKKLSLKQKILLKNLLKYMNTRRFPTGHIIKSISLRKAEKILKNKQDTNNLFNSAPKLLIEESQILNELGINNRIWGRSLNINPLGNYSLCYNLFISQKGGMEQFYKQVGFTSDNKQEKLIKVIKGMDVKNGIKVI